MVQLPTTNYYLQKSNIVDNNYEQNRKKNMYIFFLNSFEFGKNVISEISGRLLIGQNFLGVILLGDIFLQFKKGRNDLTNTYGG